MSEDLRTLSNDDLTSIGDKAWDTNDKERMEAVKAEKLRRAAENQGMKVWMKVPCWLALYVLGTRGVGLFGIGGLIAMILGATAASAGVPFLDSVIKKSRKRKGNAA